MAQKPHQIVTAWHGRADFGEIARLAALRVAAGDSPEAVRAAVAATFGPAPAPKATLQDTPAPLQLYGELGVDFDDGPVEQMRTALRLPIAVRGVLAPDAHLGYGLPIGGVFAAQGAVAPFMVGVDIGCRVHCSLFAMPPADFRHDRAALFTDLCAVTVFGAGQRGEQTAVVDHPILADDRWQATPFLRSLLPLAERQLGTSGAGNHFGDLMIGEVLLPAALPGVPPQFAALLTHSGSRGVGFKIATKYSKLATQETAKIATVPPHYEWLSTEGAGGQEYLHAMAVAGDFARANHEVIHARFAQRTGLQPVQVVQNHHNFAWIEDGLVVHRKGATPAGVGVLGVIPGTMADSSYIVEGLGNPASLQSASHGAGRWASRTKAKQTIAMADVLAYLAARDVLVQGVALDESPQAYKDIERVIALQVAAGLLRPVARLTPIAVRMAGEPGED